MSKRLQVLLDEKELAEIQRIARRRRTTVAEWVREVIRIARDQEPLVDPRRKLEAVKAAYLHSFPAPDIDQMLAEVERGYLDGPGA
jgi:hypothetical protein